jgi:hypothetical protein
MAKSKKSNSDTSKRKIIKKSSEKKTIEQTLNFPDKENTAMTTVEESMTEVAKGPKKSSKELVIAEIKKELTEAFVKQAVSIEESSKGFTLNEPVYLQIHVGNIYSIFGSGIILPAKYIKNRAFHDSQSFEQEYLLLTNGVFSIENDSTALLELNMLNNEFSDLKIFGGVAYLDKPISISRIKRICVANERVKKEIISTALVNDGGIIPDDLVVPSLPDKLFRVQFEKPDFKGDCEDYTNKITQHNKVLGTLAFLKNYAILLSEKSNTAVTYPEHYFYALQSLNDAQPLQVPSNERAVTFYSQLFRLQNGIDNASLKWIFDRVNTAKNFNDEDIRDFGSVFLNTITSKEAFNPVKELLNNLRLSLERKKTIKDILQLPGADKFTLYLFAFLRVYGNTSTEEKSISRIDVPEYVSQSYGEFVFATLGYFYGYSTLRNFEDKLAVRDSVFLDVLNISKRLSIKFELTTMLDYIVIESVYSNVFIRTGRNVKTDFLESDSIKQEWVKKQIKVPDNYTYRVEEIFGKQIYQINRKLISSELEALMDKLPLEIPIISDLGVFCYRNKIPYHFINMGDLFRGNRLQHFIYFKKEDLKDAVVSKKISAQDLKHRIESSISAKEI